MYFKFVGHALEISLRFSVLNFRLINDISNLIYNYDYDVSPYHISLALTPVFHYLPPSNR